MAAQVPTETPVILRLSPRTRSKLVEQAAKSGQDLSAVASELIEQIINRPSVAEIMAPVWEQVAESGMSDDDIDNFLHDELDAHRREKKANSA